MREREFEDWLEEQIPAQPPVAVDARIRAAGNAVLAQRRRSRGPRGWRWGGAAAALIAVATGVWALASAWSSEQSVVVETELAATGAGAFVLAPGTTFERGFWRTRLELLEGEVAVRAGTQPLEVTFPGGSLRLEQGHGVVQVGVVQITDTKDPTMTQSGTNDNVKQRSWRRRAAIVVITLAAGWGTLEYGGTAEDLLEGDKRTLVVEADSTTAGGVKVTPQESVRNPNLRVPTTGASGPTTDPTHEPEAATATEQTFRGQVVDKRTGKPVAGARVAWALKWSSQTSFTARHEQGSTTFGLAEPFAIQIGDTYPQLPGSALLVTESGAATSTDADGIYTLPHCPHEKAALHVAADGYVDAFAPAPTASAERGEEVVPITRLAPARTLTGRFVDPQRSRPRGEPQFMTFGIQLREPELPGWTFEWRQRLAPDFTFEITVGDLESVELVFLTQGYEPVQRAVDLAEGVTHVEVTLEPRPCLFGRVLDHDGRPVPGVNILVKSGKKGWFRTSLDSAGTSTNLQGEYVVNVSGPDGEISAVASGFAPFVHKGIPKDHDEQPFDITLERSEGGSLDGILRDDRGITWSTGGSVWAQLAATGSSSRFDIESDGSFTLSQLPPGSYDLEFVPTLTLREDPLAWAENPKGRAHVRFTMAGVEVQAGERRSLEVRIARGQTVRGLYLDDTGTPVANEPLSLYEPNLVTGKHERQATLDTDDDGSFEFVGVPPGTYAVAVERTSRYQLVTVADRPVEVIFGGNATRVTGTLLKNGRPLARADVGLGRLERSVSEARTDVTSADGRFEFSSASPGRHVFHAVDPLARMAMLAIVDVTEADQDLEIEWPQTEILVRVGGEPLPRDVALRLSAVTIEGVRLEGAVPAAYLQLALRPSEDGRTFHFAGVSAGRYRLETVGGERAIFREFEVSNQNLTVDVQ
ncbi:MAG: hypothetical protein AB7O52_03450 [Planctomycetota bacterium]